MTRRQRNPNACRVCGCTEDRACEGGCWWVRVERGGEFRGDAPVPPLCSACAGTAADLLEVLGRIASMPRTHSGGFECVVVAARAARAARKRFAERNRPPPLRPAKARKRAGLAAMMAGRQRR